MQLHISNFRSIADAELTLRQGLTILIGPNGSGKTCLLSALKFVRDILIHGIGLAVAKSGGSKRNFRRGTKEIQFNIVMDYGERTIGLGRKRVPFYLHWNVAIAPRGKEQLSAIVEESLQIVYRSKLEVVRVFEASVVRRNSRRTTRKVSTDKRGRFGRDVFRDPWRGSVRETKKAVAASARRTAHQVLRRLEDIQDRSFLPELWSVDEKIRQLWSNFKQLNEYNILPEIARQSSDQLPVVEMQPNGRNLSEVIYTLESRNYHRLNADVDEIDMMRFRNFRYPLYHEWPRRLVRGVAVESLYKALDNINRELAAAVRPIEAVTVEMDPTSGKRFVVFKAGMDRFSPEEVSDGTMKWLCILVSIYVPFSTVYLLEEPENFLHPWMQQKLIAIMREEAASQGSIFILTSHSATILNAARAEEVVLVRPSDRGTRTESLQSKEDIKRVLNESQFGLGDLWVSGAIGGVPA